MNPLIPRSDGDIFDVNEPKYRDVLIFRYPDNNQWGQTLLMTLLTFEGCAIRQVAMYTQSA
jgi:hypothetical protein